MDRMKAYAALAQELEHLRFLPYKELVGYIHGPPIEKTLQDGAEIISIDLRVGWANANRREVRILASADGPSCWRLERLEESVIVVPPLAES